MYEEIPYDNIKIKKEEVSRKDKLITFIQKFEVDELNRLNIFENKLSKEDLNQEKLNPLINFDKMNFYFLESDNEILGLFTLNLLNQSYDISFIIKKEKRNKGYGKLGLHLLIKELTTIFQNINEYHFKISKSNIFANLVVYGNNGTLVKETNSKNVLKIVKNNKVWFHKVPNKDMAKIMEITNAAKSLLKKNGSLQWQQGYPNEETFQNDIKNEILYGLYEDNELMGFGAYVTGKDVNYIKMNEGKWEIPANDKDIAVHRIAVAQNAHGKQYGVKILLYAIQHAKKFGCLTVKVDTHKKNIPMQKCILKCGFKYRGIITILSEKLDNLRLAYEFIL